MAKDQTNPYAMYPEDEPPMEPGSPGGRERRPSSGNPAGVLGLVLAILGPLAPIGVVISLLALRREPRGAAIAGVIVGIVITLITLGCGGLVGFGVWLMFDVRDEYEEIKGDFEVISSSIELHRSQNGELPSDLAELGLPVEATTDPYGEAYVFVRTGGSWRLGFKGLDGVAGTDDDIEIPAGTTIGGFETMPNEPLLEALATGAMEEMLR